MDAQTNDTEQAAYDGKALRKQGEAYMERIRAAERREKRWRDDAYSAEKAFAVDEDSSTDGKLYDFNILHSNVETIVPAIYNSTPVPDIRPRRVEATGEKPKPPQMQPDQMADPAVMAQFQQAAQIYAAKEARDKAAKDFAMMIERAIAVQIDDNALDTEIEAAAQDAFLAGRGIVPLRFEGEHGATGSRRYRGAIIGRDRQSDGKMSPGWRTASPCRARPWTGSAIRT